MIRSASLRPLIGFAGLALVGAGSAANAQSCASCGTVARADAFGGSYIGQSGIPNTALVMQGAAGDLSSVVQGGAGNSATVTQGALGLPMMAYSTGASLANASAWSEPLNLPVGADDNRLVEAIAVSTDDPAPPLPDCRQPRSEADGGGWRRVCDLDERGPPGRYVSADQIAGPPVPTPTVLVAEVADEALFPSAGDRAK